MNHPHHNWKNPAETLPDEEGQAVAWIHPESKRQVLGTYQGGKWITNAGVEIDYLPESWREA